jgi:hypothetical protein
MPVTGKQVSVTDAATAIESDSADTPLASSTARIKNRDSTNSVYLGSDTVTGPGVNEVQAPTVGTQSAGQFKLTLVAEQTGDLAFDADGPTTIQTELEGLANIGAGNVTVTGSSSPWAVTFQGDLAAENIAEMTMQDGTTPLSGGSGEGVSTTTAGYPGPSLTADPGFELQPADAPLTVELERGAAIFAACASGLTARVDVLELGD